MQSRLHNALRAALYPGLDLHTRNRASLAKFWRKGARDVLDAGSGNGYFSWLAYKSGARVVAWNIEQKQVDKARDFLIGFRKADPQRLRFECRNLYTLNVETRQFDEIICYETLEHVLDDKFVVREFFRLLRPGGILHLCCPNAMHPEYYGAEYSQDERLGGHVRAGYTQESYRDLLEPIGFELRQFSGIGPPMLCKAENAMRKIRTLLPESLAVPLLPFVLPIVWAAKFNPPIPLSIYVQASKPR